MAKPVTPLSQESAPETSPELEAMLAKILPVLEQAVQGDYSGQIEMTPGDPHNELYAGIQLLLDTIVELEGTNARLYDYLARRHGLYKEDPPKNT